MGELGSRCDRRARLTRSDQLEDEHGTGGNRGDAYGTKAHDPPPTYRRRRRQRRQRCIELGGDRLCDIDELDAVRLPAALSPAM